MTPTQRNLARLAYDNGCAWAAHNTPGENHWQDMVRDGLAERAGMENGMRRFVLTDKGRAMVEMV